MTAVSHPPFQFVRTSPLSLETTVARLKTAIEAADVWVLHEIDPQALLRRAGMEIAPARQLLFFHPRYMQRLLDANPAAVLEAPLKFAVLTLEGESIVRWLDPAQSFDRYGDATLQALGAELSALCEQIVASALGSAS